MYLKIISFCLLFLASPFLWAGDGLYAINDTVSSQWQFYQSKNSDLTYSQLPLEQWVTVAPSKLITVKNKDGLYGWYKITFDWQAPVDEALTLYLQSIRYGDETWLNGRKIGATGHSIKQWDFLSTNPHNMGRQYTLPEHLLKPKNNTLMIKVSLGFGETFGAMYPGGVGIGGDTIGIGRPDHVIKLYTEQLLKSVIIDAVIIVLGLVDIFIIIFLFRKSIHHFREFWALLIGSIILFLSSFLLDIFYVLAIRPGGTDLLMVTSMMLAPLTNGLYFWSFYNNIPKKFVIAISVVWLCLYIAILTPITLITPAFKCDIWVFWTALSVIVFIYCLLSAIIGAKQKHSGALWQIFGLTVYFMSIRTQWLPSDFFEHRNIIIGTLILRYSLLFSYFSRINKMSRNYKSLSSRMLVTIENNKQDIARELHDDLGQHLTAAKLQLLLYNQGHTKTAIRFIKDEINASIQSVRELIDGLHPLVLDQLGFERAVTKEAERLTKLYGVHIETDIKLDEVNLNSQTEKHLYRILQEALHNAIKHGKAHNITIKINVSQRQLVCIITDDGVGINAKSTMANHPPINSGGFGLVSIKERVAILDGHIDVTSNQNNQKNQANSLNPGTQLTLRLNLNHSIN